MKISIKPISFFVFSIIIVVFVVFVSCTKKDIKTKIRVGYIPVTHCIPLYIAQEDGLFAKAGLDVELVPLPGGPKILEALSSGDIQFGFSNVASVILARSQGRPILAITGGPLETINNRDHAIMVSLNSPIMLATDLKGKKIAINSRRNIDHLMIILYLEKLGLSESDVELIEVPFPRMEATVAAGTVDAVATAEPFITMGIQHKVLRVLDWNYVAVRKKTFVSTYAVNEHYQNKNNAVVAKFVQVIGQASEIANTDAKRARNSLLSFTKITQEVANDVSLPYFLPDIDIDNVGETETLLQQTGLLDKVVNIKSIINK